MSGLKKHKDLTNIHRIHCFTYADATARAAATGFVAADIGKVAYQQDNDTFWVLVDDTGPTWCEITNKTIPPDTDVKVGCSANDTTAGFLSDKLTESEGTNTNGRPLEWRELNDGGDEDCDLRFDESKIDHNNLTNAGGNQHIDWTAASAGTIDPTNYVDNNDDEKAKVTSNDTTPGYLFDKIQAGTNVTIVENNDGGNETMTISATGTLSATLAGVQARRTTTYATTTSFVDLTLDATDVENDATVVEHDNTNTDRIIAHETGLYLISYNFTVDSDSSGTVDARVRKNDSVVLNSSLRCLTDSNDDDGISNTFIAELTAGDFISLQAKNTSGTHTIEAEANLSAVKMEGAQGPQGDPGTGSTVNIADEGTNIANTPHSRLNFIGSGVTATDGGAGTADITISAGGDFSDGGEAGGADRTLGNTDNFALSFLTNALNRLKIKATGAIEAITNVSGYLLTIKNTKGDGGGNGALICGGETLGDLALKICDADETHDIMEIEADQGFVTLSKTYAQTLADNGVVYGMDLQDTGQTKDFNTQHGCYRVEGDKAVCKNNFTATVNPGANDDTGLNYDVGSRWINVSTDKEFVCLDATSTAAVWTETTQSGGGGLTVSQATATANTTTTSSTYVLINGMTLTPGAGDYVITFSSSWKNSSDEDMFCAIYVNGSIIDYSERMTRMESSTIDTELSIHTQAYVTAVGAGQAIEVRWKDTGGTTTMLERNLIAQKVG